MIIAKGGNEIGIKKMESKMANDKINWGKKKLKIKIFLCNFKLFR